MVYTDAGEDLIVSCAGCGYAANIEKATSKLAVVEDLAATGDGMPELVHTPGKGAIADVAEFLQISPAQDIKTVAYMVEVRDGKKSIWQPVVVFLRGDHFVNETKLLTLVGGSELRPMQADELETYFHGPAGYLGPIGLNAAKKLHDGGVNVILDLGLENRKNLVAGANKLDHHVRNVTPGRDFAWTVAADIRNVAAGEACPECGTETGAGLKVAKAVEIGHIFKLGYKYTQSMGARVLDPNGKEVAPIMGSYGIGIERILTSSIEQSNDANGFCLPPSIAPFEVVVTVTNIADQSLLAAGTQIAESLEAAGFDVLLDDRDERAGVKFKDADLIGIPFRINVGKKVTDGKVELVNRSTASSQDIVIAEVVRELQQQTGR
jgi:prolyl-tRNA synthetase